MSQVRAAAQPGTLGHYTLIERLGTGGNAEVWKAHDESRGVDVALKVLARAAARNPVAWETLEREHDISGRLQHPGILQVLAPERVGDVMVLPMELAAGGDLRRLRGAGYLEIVPVLLEVAEALEYAHARGVVHRDLKPGNVLFDSRGRVKLADFGIAALLPAAGAAPDPREGGGGHSPFTSSPEQLRGEPASAADDIYGLGALAYELLSGQPPYYPNFELQRVLTQPVPELVPLRQVPPELSAIVMRLLAKRAADRPATMQQVMDELDATLNATLSFAPEGVETDDDEDIPQPSIIRRPEPKPGAAVAPPARAAAAVRARPAGVAAPRPTIEPRPVIEKPFLGLPAEPVPSDVPSSDARYRPQTPAPAQTPLRPRPTETNKPRRGLTARPLFDVSEPSRPAPLAPSESAHSASPPRGPEEPIAAAAAQPDSKQAVPTGHPSVAPLPIAPPEKETPTVAPPATHNLAEPVATVSADEFFDLGFEELEPQLRATPPLRGPLGEARFGAVRPSRWPYLLGGLLSGVLLICAATAAAIFWLPRQDLAGLQPLLARISALAPSQLNLSPATAPAKPAPAAAPAAPPPKPKVDPAALARLNTQTTAYQKRAAALAARGAVAWDGADFSAAQVQAAESSGAAAAGGIALATQHLRQANQLLDKVTQRAPRVDRNSRRAIVGSRRAGLLRGVVPLLEDGQKAESTQNYSRAAQDYSQALALDPGNTLAKSGLARANAAFGNDGYARAVGAGFAALGAGRLIEAQGNFQRALGLRPKGKEATEGLQRVSLAMEAGRIASLRQQAATLESEQRWSQAAAVYDSALQVDPALEFAKRGKAQDEERAQLSSSLQQIIDHPSRLDFPAVRDEAVTLLQEAREQTPSPTLQAQVERLTRLMPQLDRPVQLNMISDNATEVNIPSIGVFGSFGRREIRLQPGTYTVIGTRDGYRAVQMEFTVEPGQQSVTITVTCTQPF
jgi:serine/threonine protein kinase/tetratricopeptide (TPR) repeat protein